MHKQEGFAWVGLVIGVVLAGVVVVFLLPDQELEQGPITGVSISPTGVPTPSPTLVPSVTSRPSGTPTTTLLPTASLELAPTALPIPSITPTPLPPYVPLPTPVTHGIPQSFEVEYPQRVQFSSSENYTGNIQTADLSVESDITGENRILLASPGEGGSVPEAYRFQDGFRYVEAQLDTLVLVNEQTGEEQLIFRNPTFGGVRQMVHHPILSIDQEKIFFAARTVSSAPERYEGRNLQEIGVDGTGLRQITNLTLEQFKNIFTGHTVPLEPLIAMPDGQRLIAWGTQNDRYWGLNFVDIQTGEITPIARANSIMNSVTISNDARYLGYALLGSGVYVVNLETLESKRLSDGSKIVFVD